MRNFATAMTLAAALMLAACDADPAPLPKDEPVLVDDCPDGVSETGEPCK